MTTNKTRGQSAIPASSPRAAGKTFDGSDQAIVKAIQTSAGARGKVWPVIVAGFHGLSVDEAEAKAGRIRAALKAWSEKTGQAWNTENVYISEALFCIKNGVTIPADRSDMAAIRKKVKDANKPPAPPAPEEPTDEAEEPTGEPIADTGTGLCPEAAELLREFSGLLSGIESGDVDWDAVRSGMAQLVLDALTPDALADAA